MPPEEKRPGEGDDAGRKQAQKQSAKEGGEQQAKKEKRLDLKPTDYDILIKNRIYPDAASIFSFTPKSLEQVKKECIVVLDTNELLLPYLVGTHQLTDIAKVYKKLIQEKRLVVPGQAAREFVAHRSSKIGDVVNAWKNLQSRMGEAVRKTVDWKSYPLLENLDEYKNCQQLWKEAEEHLKACQASFSAANKMAGQIVKRIQEWYLSDPVTELYRELFTPDVVVDLQLDVDECRTDQAWRLKYLIPPGFNDAEKADQGIGDILIWKVILHVGRERKKPVIFVSRDQKNDWVHKSGETILTPRYELIDEFRRASDGQTLHVIQLADLLGLFGADESTVSEVRATDTAGEIQIRYRTNTVGKILVGYRTDKGDMVRSKSELVIANMLYLLKDGLENYEYERRLQGTANMQVMYPDFTFTTVAGHPILWEHLGMLSNPALKAAWERKREWYADNGFVEGKNLFTTDEEGGLDSRQIRATAEAIKKLL